MTENAKPGDVEETLKGEIATILSVTEEEIGTEIPLAALGMDSIRFVETIIMIEREFGVQLMETGLTPEDVKDVASLASTIRANRGSD